MASRGALGEQKQMVLQRVVMVYHNLVAERIPKDDPNGESVELLLLLDVKVAGATTLSAQEPGHRLACVGR